jgi:tetratricopeptide (TPR) repeat protein
LCEDALAAIGDGDPVAQAHILAGLADYIASSEGDAPAAEQLSRHALALARKCDHPAALARAIFVHCEVLGWSPRIEERLALASELNQLAAAHEDRRGEANAAHISALARLESGDVPGFDSDLERIESLRMQLDYWYIDVFALLWRGMRALMDGRFEAVEQNANELLAHARHEPNIVNLYAGQLSWLRREQGRLGELRPLVEDAIKHSPDVVGFRCGLALICADIGELDQAARQLERLAADNFAALPRDATWTTSLTLLAEVAAAVGDRARARALSTLLIPFSGRLIVCTKGMVCAGAADRYLGLLAATDENWEQSDRYFRSALALETRIEAPNLIARTSACYERALRGRERRAQPLVR